MVDLDMYYPNTKVEMFVQQLTVRLNKYHPTTKVYISTANPYSSWLQKLYNFYNNTELMEGLNVE